MSRGNANPVAFTKRYFTVSRKEIGYLRFILESYDGLAFMRTIDKRSGVIEIAYPSERRGDVDGLLSALIIETGMSETPPPEQLPSL